MMKRGDLSSLAFGIVAAEDAIEREHVYHVSYPQWLHQVRNPRAPTAEDGNPYGVRGDGGNDDGKPDDDVARTER